MSDQPPRPGQSMVDGLVALANPGRGKHERLDDYKKHLDLADPILRVLGIEDVVVPERRELLLRKVFAGVAAQARAEAEAALSHPGSKLGEPSEAGRHPAFKSAAAGELLGCFDEEARERVRKKYVRDDSVWSDRFKGADNTGPLAQRRTCAGAWIGGQTHKNVGRSHKQIELFRAFEAALLDYVDRQRERIRAFILEQDAPIESDNATAVPDAPASDAPRSPTPFQPRNGLPRQTSCPRDPELQRWFEQLATEVHRQLNDEDSKDQAADPIPMPVRWSITEQYPADQPVNVWGEGDGVRPAMESGTIRDTIDLFESIPSGRLIVVGRGGAGKTVLARKLALDLLERRPDTAVPVIFHLSSWDLTEKVSLRDWMAGQLVENYPALKAMIQDMQRGRTTVAAALVHGRHVLPILDGLDEVGPPHRTEALRRINGALHRGDRLVLTSRPDEYAEPAEAGVVVTGAAVIELHDLTVDDLTAYLPRTTPVIGRQTNQSKWGPVLAQLREPGADGAAALSEVLTTPLMASLARAIYSETRADPAELLDTERFPNVGAVTDHLLDAFVHVKYDDLPRDRDTPSRPQWKPDDARRWLGFLAIMMSAQGTHELAWWKPGYWRSMRLFNWPANALGSFATAAMIGLWYAWILPSIGNPTSRLDMLWPILVISALACVAISGAIWIGADVEPRELNKPSWWWVGKYPGTSFRDSWKALPLREAALCGVAIVSSIVISEFSLGSRFLKLLLPRSSGMGPAFLISFMAIMIVSMLSVVGFISIINPGKIEARNPTLVLRKDRRAAIATGLYYGGVISVMCGITWVFAGHPVWVVATPVLFAYAVIIAICLSAYGSWLIRRTGFALVRWLPRPSRCMDFLDDACRRGVLRQSGGVYQFRHALLQERLAIAFLDHRDPWVTKHRTILYVRTHLALARLDAGIDADATVGELRELIEKHRRLRQNEYGVATLWDRLIHTLRKTGRRDDALNEATLFQQFIDGIGTRGARQYWHYHARRVLADSLVDAGRLTEAVAEYTEALRLAESYWGQDDEDAADTRTILAALRGELADQPR